MLITVFVGFAPSYYLAGAIHAPLPSLAIHVHVVVFSCWILLGSEDKKRRTQPDNKKSIHGDHQRTDVGRHSIKRKIGAETDGYNNGKFGGPWGNAPRASESPGDVVSTPPLWISSLPGGELRRAGQAAADAATRSPDGSEMAFVQGSVVYRSRSDGSSAQEAILRSYVCKYPRARPSKSQVSREYGTLVTEVDFG